MIQVMINKDQFKLSSVTSNVPKQLLSLIKERAMVVVEDNTPVDTGHMRSNWISLLNGNTLTISNNTEYAVFVNSGTGIYGSKGAPITPVNGNYLVFTPKGSGETVFATMVKGIQPHNIIDKSSKTIKNNINNYIKEAITKSG